MKEDHNHAMSVATTMLNRAEKHEHQTPEMRDAIKIFKAWIEKNRTTGKNKKLCLHQNGYINKMLKNVVDEKRKLGYK
jgi:hypothetical protein